MLFPVKDFKKLAVLLFLTGSFGVAQTLPEGVDTVPFTCPPRERLEQPRTRRSGCSLNAGHATAPYYPLTSPLSPPSRDTVLMPVEGVRVAQVADTWGAARDDGRFHEGQDIFAPTGTPFTPRPRLPVPGRREPSRW